MSRYILRLDDAAEKQNYDNWLRMEELLDKYNVQPIVGIIPHCEDLTMDSYAPREDFWNIVGRWKEKGWCIALHGYNHVYGTMCGGMNPINQRSEFAGEPYEIQAEKIKLGIEILNKHGYKPRVFFAPSHTFDKNTIKALRENSSIDIISDTIANDTYYEEGIYFIPLQSGRVRKLPFKLVTFCYHPNTMKEEDFKYLDKFLNKCNSSFISFEEIRMTKRKRNLLDRIYERLYFVRKKS